MPETVECSECGASYDSDEHPFCPRCGSTARGAPVQGAVASAARRDPGRRRVQASGVVLFAIGLLFLTSAGLSFLVPQDEAVQPLVGLMADQPGGDLVIRLPAAPVGEAAGADAANATTSNSTAAAPASVRLLDLDGNELANATAEAGGELRLAMPQASVVVEAVQGQARWNRTAVALRGEAVTLDLRDAPGGDAADARAEDAVAVSGSVGTATMAARWVLLVFALVLAAGGACAAFLRLYGLAVAGAITGALFGLLALVGFLAAGLLFALPFGLCAYFILRGRRHFRRRAVAPPPNAPLPPSP